MPSEIFSFKKQYSCKFFIILLMTICVGCSNQDVAFLYNQHNEGVACYGDSYFMLEGGISLVKRMQCESACQNHGFQQIAEMTKLPVGSLGPIISDNKNSQIPIPCL